MKAGTSLRGSLEVKKKKGLLWKTQVKPVNVESLKNYKFTKTDTRRERKFWSHSIEKLN